MTNLFVKPAPDCFVRHETTGRPLPAEGDFWPDSTYLRRRLRHGDIELATAPGAVPPVPASDETDDASAAQKNALSQDDNVKPISSKKKD